MSNIPFFFPSPTPRYFRDKGLFKNPKNKAFVDWCFERCSPDERIVFHDNKKITLKPYQFIFGRLVCVEETGLTENEVRTQQKRWEDSGFLKKTPNKTTNRFTLYEWVLTDFIKTDHQQNHQQTTNRPPINNHNQDQKIERYKKEHHPYPSSPKIVVLGDDVVDGLTDDLLLSNQEEKAKTEIYPGIFFTQEELNACIAIKGSIDSVKESIAYIMKSPSRKNKIHDWPNALAKWQIKTDIKPQLKENEKLAQYLSKTYDSFEKGNGYQCRLYHDKVKDQKGLLIESESPFIEQFFIAFIESKFKENTLNYIKEKNINKPKQKIANQK